MRLVSAAKMSYESNTKFQKKWHGTANGKPLSITGKKKIGEMQ
jgi:hypothetical protein